MLNTSAHSTSTFDPAYDLGNLISSSKIGNKVDLFFFLSQTLEITSFPGFRMAAACTPSSFLRVSHHVSGLDLCGPGHSITVL